MKQTEGERAAIQKAWIDWLLGSELRGGHLQHEGFCAGWQASRLATVREIAEWLRQEARESGSIRLDNKADDLLAKYGLHEQGGAK